MPDGFVSRSLEPGKSSGGFVVMARRSGYQWLSGPERGHKNHVWY